MTEGFFDRHYFLIRRLHSFLGVLPIGVYLFPHLMTNSSIVWGRWLNEEKHGDAGVETFQHEVDFIHSLPGLVLIEWGVLFAPIAVHALLGVVFAMSGRSNLDRYRYQANWRYALQRWTGYIGILFIFMHITSLRFGWTYGNLMPDFDAHHAASSTAEHFQRGVLGTLGVATFYLVGVLSLVFHFANGLWTAGITWGLTLSDCAMRRWGLVCLAVGVGLGVASVMAIAGFATLDIEHALEVERSMSAAAPGAGGLEHAP